MKKFLSVLLIAAVVTGGLTSCKKLLQPVYKQTSNGSGQLNFSTTTGDSYREAGNIDNPLMLLALLFVPVPHSSEPRAFADYHVDENNVLTVRAILDDCGINPSRKWFPRRIFISAPLSDIAPGAILSPKIEICHLVRPAISDGPDKRDAEFAETSITDTWMKIHGYDAENKVLTGFFAFQGEYADSTGRVRKVKVKDGFFDVSEDQIK